MFPSAADWVSGAEAAAILVVLVLATLGTATLFLTGLVGYRRRRTRVYLLMTAALGILVSRSVIGFGTVLGIVPMPVHHLIEHGSDFAVATLVLYALYSTGTPSRAG
jgi:hypothetical protein